MSVPKVVHYVWLSGEEKPKTISKCIQTWKILKKNGFEVKEWTAADFDFDEMPIFVQEALKARKWAFVTDYLRLKILYERGGIS